MYFPLLSTERNLNPKAACLKRREEEKAEDGPKIPQHHLLQQAPYPALPVGLKSSNFLSSTCWRGKLFSFFLFLVLLGTSAKSSSQSSTIAFWHLVINSLFEMKTERKESEIQFIYQKTSLKKGEISQKHNKKQLHHQILIFLRWKKNYEKLRWKKLIQFFLTKAIISTQQMKKIKKMM